MLIFIFISKFIHNLQENRAAIFTKQILIDTTKNLSVEDVASGSYSHAFDSIIDPKNSYIFNTAYAYWIRFKAKNLSDTSNLALKF